MHRPAGAPEQGEGKVPVAPVDVKQEPGKRETPTRGFPGGAAKGTEAVQESK